MSQYLLKLSGSNQIESIFEWDGSGSLTPPFGYEFELIVDPENQSISYSSSFVETSVSESQTDGIFYGNVFGTFTGNIVGSTFNGVSIENIINSTEYGTLYEINNTDVILDTFETQSWFSVLNESSILLSGNNGVTRYSQSLAEVVRNNEKNYILTLKNTNKPLQTAKYLVKNTELIGDYDSPTYYLNVENINYITSDLFNNNKSFSELGVYNQEYWHIDFDFNITNDMLSEYTGSFTGSFDGEYTGVFTGSFTGEHTGSFTGSFDGYAELTGSFLGLFNGALIGTASNSIFSQTASFTENASRIDVIEKSTNWTKPSWAKTIRVTCVGGGGGGGAAPASEESGPTTGGGGGGGGTITTGEFAANTLPDVITITVGAGGIGAFYKYNGTLINASNGGDSYFGRYLLARGGNAGSNGASGLVYAFGGSTIPNIHYLNTGAGGGGAGTVDGYIGSPLFITDASMAPPLPMPDGYTSTGGGGSYYIVAPTPIPSVIAPTGGGGGLGYDFDNGGRQYGINHGGKLSAYALTNADNKLSSLTPFEYGSGSYEIIDSESIDFGTYPAYNTTVGLGGRGGNPFYIDTDLSSAMPTDGTLYGGGGGGAFGGGVDGRYTNGQMNDTPYNFGANGAQGVVVIISEA